MTSKGYAVLKEFIKNSELEIQYVVGERDLKIKNDFYDEIKSFCLLNSIKFYNRKDSPLIPTEYLKVAVSWKWIINSEVSKLIVFHDSLLPRLRGFNPLVTSLINGDKFIGVSAIFASSEYDQGDIIYQSRSEVSYPISILEAIHLIEENYMKVARRLVARLSKNLLPKGIPQDEKLATYSLWRGENDYFIDWDSSSKLIRRFIDAVGYPYKGAASLLNGNLVRILKAKEFKDVVIENRAPGKIIFFKEKKPIIVCGSGLLLVEKLEDDNSNSLLPLKNFRVKFTSF
tara:strand:+ start:53 stop:913 length:861 start_codon:yes stop_codon:yes gene_type:complete